MQLKKCHLLSRGHQIWITYRCTVEDCCPKTIVHRVDKMIWVDQQTQNLLNIHTSRYFQCLRESFQWQRLCLPRLQVCHIVTLQNSPRIITMSNILRSYSAILYIMHIYRAELAAMFSQVANFVQSIFINKSSNNLLNDSSDYIILLPVLVDTDLESLIELK